MPVPQSRMVSQSERILFRWLISLARTDLESPVVGKLRHGSKVKGPEEHRAATQLDCHSRRQPDLVVHHPALERHFAALMDTPHNPPSNRSEERRVGKECRSRW